MSPQGMPEAGSDDEEDLQAQLLAHYLGGAAGRLASVEGVLKAYRAAPADPSTGEALFRQLHTLAGSAGTYGFKTISVEARSLEKEVKAALEHGPVPEALLAQVEAFKVEMARQFVEAGASLDSPPPPRAAIAPPSWVTQKQQQAVARVEGTQAAGAPRGPHDDSPFIRDGLAGPKGMSEAMLPAMAAAPSAQAAPPTVPDLPSFGGPVEPTDPHRRSTRKLLLAVLEGAQPASHAATEAGTAVALAGANLACVGPTPAARAYRASGGEGQVIAFLASAAPPAHNPADGTAPDLPLPCGSRAVQSAMLANACDAGLLCSDSPEALADARALIRAGKPLAVAKAPAGLRQALSAPAHLLHEAETLPEAVLAMLFALAPATGS
jgi:HPt (histidine-containing phosphotransfer) domain-containing protein